MVLPRLTRFYLVLLGFTEFYWVFTVFYRLLLGFAEFYLVFFLFKLDFSLIWSEIRADHVIVLETLVPMSHRSFVFFLFPCGFLPSFFFLVCSFTEFFSLSLSLSLSLSVCLSLRRWVVAFPCSSASAITIEFCSFGSTVFFSFSSGFYWALPRFTGF